MGNYKRYFFQIEDFIKFFGYQQPPVKGLCIWGDISLALWCRKSLLMNGISIYHECYKETCQQMKTTKKAAKK